MELLAENNHYKYINKCQAPKEDTVIKQIVQHTQKSIFFHQKCVQVGVPHNQSDSEESEEDEDNEIEEHFWWDCPYCKDIWLTEEERNTHLEICMEK